MAILVPVRNVSLQAGSKSGVSSLGCTKDAEWMMPEMVWESGDMWTGRAVSEGWKPYGWGRCGYATCNGEANNDLRSGIVWRFGVDNGC